MKNIFMRKISIFPFSSYQRIFKIFFFLKFFLFLFMFLSAGFPEIFALDHNNKKVHFTLEEAINQALMANRSIANAIDNVTQSSFSLVSTKAEFELKIFPEVYADLSKEEKNYGFGLSLNKKLPTGTNIVLSPVIQKIGNIYETGADVILTQPLLRRISPFYNLSGVEQSEYYLRTTQRELYLTQVNIVLSTISAVYDVIRKREILRLQQSSYGRLQGFTEAAIVKQKMGLATAIDVYRARIKLKQAESFLISSQESYQDALDNLKIILVVPMEQMIEVSAPLKYNIVRIEESKAIEVSLRERTELYQFQDMISNLELQSKVAKHNILPDLDLTLKYTAKGSDVSLSRSIRNNRGSFEVGLVSSGGVKRTIERATYEKSKLVIKSAERILSLKQDEIKREVKFVLRNLYRAEKNIDIQEEQIGQAKGKLELAKVKFSHGIADNFDLIEAESELRQAEISLISAVIEYIVGGYRLGAAMGTLIDKQGRLRYEKTSSK